MLCRHPDIAATLTFERSSRSCVAGNPRAGEDRLTETRIASVLDELPVGTLPLGQKIKCPV
jgi:hypothetical protein